jgi:Zn-dependent protease/CBS domain-containing protein
MPGRFAINLGRFLGIKIAVDFTWFLVFFLILFPLSSHLSDILEIPRNIAVLVAAAVIILLFASVLAHEYGHALTARVYGIGTPKIVLHMFGGVAYLESEPKKPSEEFWITVAGPAVSFILGFLFLILFYLLSASGFNETTILGFVAMYLGIINLFLAIFNCLPGFPMDGGRIVRATLWAVTGNYLLSTRVAAGGGVVVGGLMMLWGLGGILAAISGIQAPFLPVGNPMPFLLGIFLIYLAWQSAHHAELSARLREVCVRELVRPVSVVVPPDALVSDVLERYMRPFGMDQLPVVDGPRLLGSVTYDDIVQIPQRQWDWTRASEILQPYSTEGAIDPNLGAMAALQRLARMERPFLPVFMGRRLVGHVFRNDLLLALQRTRPPRIS